MSDLAVWSAIAGLWAATYLIRISFLLLLGDRRLPDLATRALALVPVTVLPALVAAMVFRPRGEWQADPETVAASLATIALGVATRNVLAAMVGGIATFVVLSLIG